MSLTCLLVAEKPSIALAIANALAGGRYETRRLSTPVHSWYGKFNGQNALFKCTGVTGHIFEVDFEYHYRDWNSCDPSELFDAPTVVKPTSGGKMVRHLKTLGTNIDYLFLWLDCDREGENIGFEVIRIVHKLMSHRIRGQKIFRAKFSSITSGELRKAFQNMGKPNRNWSDAVEARKILDLKVGVAFTRFQTTYFTKKYGKINQRALVSYGPCQTPTLGFCVRRNDERDWFKPETFWHIRIYIQNPNWPSNLHLRWNRGHLFNKEIVTMFYKNFREETQIQCVTVTKEKKLRKKPLPLNTVAMLQSASKGLHIGPKEAMRLAEHLYLSGFISYPRTETSSYPKGFDLEGTLRAQSNDSNWGYYVKNLLEQGIATPRRGSDAGDHPPITPVSYPNRELRGNERRLYEFIVKHFIATISPDCELEETYAEFELQGEMFNASGSRILKPGFLEIATWAKVDERDFPLVTPNTTIPIYKVEMESGQTEPPSFLTESDLIALMEKHGIGTDASIPQHIGNIEEREYVKVDPEHRLLKPSRLGILLAHGYHKIDPELVLPELRAYTEKSVNLIAQGEVEMEVVIEHCLKVFYSKYKYYVSKFHKMDQMFEVLYAKEKDKEKDKDKENETAGKALTDASENATKEDEDT